MSCGKITNFKAFLTYAENCRPQQKPHERKQFSYRTLLLRYLWQNRVTLWQLNFCLNLHISALSEKGTSMQIVPFIPHYQLVFANFDFASFSVISYSTKNRFSRSILRQKAKRQAAPPTQRTDFQKIKKTAFKACFETGNRPRGFRGSYGRRRISKMSEAFRYQR